MSRRFGRRRSSSLWAVIIAAAAITAGSSSIAFAQGGSGGTPQLAASGTPVDQATATRLTWWALVALDQANQTGNYSVLRDMGVPAFQAGNSAATLAASFQTLRSQNIDLAMVLNTVPVFEMPPAVANGILRARGVFPFRPVSIGFDLLFQSINGKWALFGISVVPLVQAQRRGSTNH